MGKYQIFILPGLELNPSNRTKLFLYRNRIQATMEGMSEEQIKAILEKDKKRKEYQKRYRELKGKDYYRVKKNECLARKRAKETEETRTD
jgi:hypothetical protein